MQQSGILEADLMGLIAQKGHFPAGTLFDKLPDDYLSGAILVHWKKIEATLKGETANV